MSKSALFAVVLLALTTSTNWAQLPSAPAVQRAPVARRAPARRPAAKQPGLFTETSIEKAWQQATVRQRPMLVMFTSNNCMYCKKMLKETYSHPAIRRMLAANTETVLAHAKDYPALVKRLGITGFPTSLLISPQGKVLTAIPGFVPPQDFAQQVTPALQALAQQRRTNNTRAASQPRPQLGRLQKKNPTRQ